ncbi:MAG: hypothetical protein EHM58_09445 [Ignavibacteriae bacterium]|nr:MAG: hypothetical protein EHM58_09445 [Ignavibacteriota bacterium]
MKKLILSISLFLSLHTIALIYPVNSQVIEKVYDNNFYPAFTCSLDKSLLLPGDTLDIEFTQTNWIKTDDAFNIQVYKVIDLEKFFFNKIKNYYGWNVLTADGSNIVNYCVLSDSFNMKLIPKKDTVKYQIRYHLDSKVRYIPKENGAFLIKISFRKKCAYVGYFVTNLGLITQSTYSSILCYTVNRYSGEPIYGSELSYYFQNKKIGSAKTDSAVYNMLFEKNDIENMYKTGNHSPMVIVKRGSEVTVSNPSDYFSLPQERFTAYVYTNQPVYRPPAKVNFRGIVREFSISGYNNYPNSEVNVYIKDPKGTEIFKKILKTDEFGGFSDSIELDESAELGEYKINAQLMIFGKEFKTENNNYSQTFTGSFSAEEYKKPEYKVKLETDKGQYTNRDKISIKLQADYYFGSPVQEANVEYYVFKKPLYKPWWYFSNYRWFYEDYFSGKKEDDYENSSLIYTGTAKLDKNGKAEFDYEIEENFKEKYTYYSEKTYETDYMYIVSAVVTDKSRRSVRDSKSVNVTRSQFYITSTAGKYLYKAGEKASVDVWAADFSDKPVETKFEATINRISYEKKKKKNVKITNFVTSFTGRTNYNGKGTAFFDVLNEGLYEIQIDAFDNFGKKMSTNTSCYAAGKDVYRWFERTGTIEVIPDKIVYNPSDTLRAMIITADEHPDILVTGESKSLLHYTLHKINNFSSFIEVPLNELYAPNFALSVNYISKGTHYKKEVVVPVIPIKQVLNVDLSTDKLTYKPREEGEITVKVTDWQNNPVKNASINIGIIDESIYAIKPDKTPDIKTVFYSKRNCYEGIGFSTNNSMFSGSYSYAVYPSLSERFNLNEYDSLIVSRVLGRITNAKGDGVIGALVMIDNQIAATTVKDGTFGFRIPQGKYNISLIYDSRGYEGSFDIQTYETSTTFLDINVEMGKINYATSDDKFGKRLCYGNGPLDPGENLSELLKRDTLDEITITAVQDEIEVEQSGRMISEQQIEGSPVRGIQNIVAKTSGVVQDEKGQQINIRGGRTSENLILVDGVSTTNPQDGSSFAFVSPEMLKEIENTTGKLVDAQIRSDFKDAILWLPSVTTDENGIAKIKIKLPDNLTSWRITAKVITEDTKIGQINNNFITRKDLIIRMEPPRFFQQNDEVTVSTIIHNYLNEDKKTFVKLYTDNLNMVDTAGFEKVINVGKNEEVRVDWKVKVNESTGLSRITASALTNEESDAVEYKLPIQPYGVQVNHEIDLKSRGINKSITRTFDIPEGTDIKTANVRLDLAPSAAASVITSLDDLVDFPYGCIEQTLSKFVPAIVVNNILKDLQLPTDGYLTYRLPVVLKQGLAKLYSNQHYDGGWGWWINDKSNPFMTAYVLYGLSLAKKGGYEIEKNVLRKGASYVYSNSYDKSINPVTKAFMLFSISDLDSLSLEQVRIAFNTINTDSLDNFSLALMILTANRLEEKTLRNELLNKLALNVKHDDFGAYWGDDKFNYKWYNDRIQITAMVVKALLSSEDTRIQYRDVIAESVDWLIEQRKGGSWGSTQQTAFIIYALADYIKANNELNTEYTVNVYLNNKLAAEKHVTIDDLMKKAIPIYIEGNLVQGKNEIKIEKIGEGKMYLSSILSYYSKDKSLEGADNGFDVKRSYYKLEKVMDKETGYYSYNPVSLKDFVTSGDILMVKIKVLSTDSKREYFMLEDPIPAGCEVVKDDWAYTISKEKYYDGYSGYSSWRWWYSDKTIRDNKISFFSTYLYGQESEFSYLLEAQLPGKYNVMPTTAALMYYPEVNGTGKIKKFEIRDKEEKKNDKKPVTEIK